MAREIVTLTKVSTSLYGLGWGRRAPFTSRDNIVIINRPEEILQRKR